LFPAENFGTKPTDFVNFGKIDQQCVYLVFVVWAIFIFLDLFSKIEVNGSLSTMPGSTIRIFNLCAIELTSEFNNVIITRTLENGLADECPELQRSHANLDHGDLGFFDLIRQHRFPPIALRGVADQFIIPALGHKIFT
jgi:hypothetical protein